MDHSTIEQSATHDRAHEIAAVCPYPGALLRTCIFPALGFTVSQAAKDLLVTRQTLHRILAGQAAITADMAVRLEKFCGIPSAFWLERQQAHELDRVMRANEQLLPRIPSRTLPFNIRAALGA